MKGIFVGAALGVFLASPLFAEQQGDLALRRSGDYARQRKPLRTDYLGANALSQKLAPSSNPSNDALCSTAPGFCPDYHGGNGS